MNKPRINQSSRYKQGVFIPKYPEKYIGKTKESIIYRSSWERRIMVWFDTNPAVLYWNSEDVVVKYISPIDSKPHRYFIDFVARMRLKNGLEKTFAIEVKPKKEMLPPRNSKNKIKLMEQTQTYLVNQAKWKYAREFFSEQGIDFIVINEEDMGIK